MIFAYRLSSEGGNEELYYLLLSFKQANFEILGAKNIVNSIRFDHGVQGLVIVIVWSLNMIIWNKSSFISS